MLQVKEVYSATLPNFFFHALPGADVSLCPGLQGRVGGYHVRWPGCCGSRPAGTSCSRAVKNDL